MTNTKDIKDYEKYERTIKTIQKRFKTYGYQRVKTSTFEQYDLYSKVTSSINQNEMIKVIARSGEVLVLRPDGTIPITKQVAENVTTLESEIRYFYVQDVFRQSLISEESVESTQAGVEYFSESSPEADTEVIALACHTLKDLGFNDIKIEVGHAGFFQELVQEINFTTSELEQLKGLIKAKNIVEIEPFLKSFEIDKDLKEAIRKIPLLYGNPIDVIERARSIARTPKMKETLDYLLTVYEILKLYGLETNIVVDLGLINHMGYYSGVIFQGFVENYGKPVLMGGRYDQLGNEFGATLPAIGFACEVESLIQASTSNVAMTKTPIDIKIIYAKDQLAASIVLANELRERNYSVLSYVSTKERASIQASIYEITLNEEKIFSYRDAGYQFTTIQELLTLLNGSKGVM